MEGWRLISIELREANVMRKDGYIRNDCRWAFWKYLH